MTITVLRRSGANAQPEWKQYNDRPESEQDTVATALTRLNESLDDPIRWECSCLQKKCGACAMVINGHPALACETFVRDLGEEIVLRPLSKFPVISDLVVDRGVIQENLKASGDYIGEYTPPSPKEHAHQYAAAKCLKCGLCLEVCPNYGKGEHFYGAVFANDCYLVASTSKEQGESFRKEYAGHFAAGCSKSLSCMEVCPMQIPTIASMAKLNRRG